MISTSNAYAVRMFQVCALGLKKNAVVICGDGVFRNGSRVGSNRFGPNLDQLRAGQTAGILVDSKCQGRYSMISRDLCHSHNILQYWSSSILV